MVSLSRIALPFVALLGGALLIITYVPRISNQLVLSDIQAWRDRALKENRTPREAWKLECVQADPSDPQPCSDADKAKYPKGQMQEPAVVAAPIVDAAAAPAGEDEDLEALIRGSADGGAPAPRATPTADSDEDLEALIRGAGDKPDAAVNKPVPKPGQESEDELLEMIKGKN